MPDMGSMRRLFILLPPLMIVAGATTARAETAILRNGRSIEVSGYRMSDNRIVLRMTSGGEISMPAIDVLEIRRQPKEEPPVPPAPAEAGHPSIAAPQPVAAQPPAADVPEGAPAAIAPAELGRGGGVAGAADEALLPVGGVFDPAALHEMAGKIARRHGVDESLVNAVIQVESRYDPFAVSPRGAMGLMQLMPRTAERFEVANAFDPVQNVDGGVRYLKELLARYSGQVRLALAAYNAGEEAVERHGGIPPYRETVDYVKRVLTARR
jgi:soluble lytic murein transglycosylase-like protein